MLTLPLLIGVIAAAALLWFWQDSLAARERANFAAQAACERMGLQFLDGTVAFSRIGFARDNEARLRLRRTYIFDYTAGSIDRLQGFVLLLDKRVESIGFASDTHTGHAANQTMPLHTEQDAPPRESTASTDVKVLDFNEWRQRRGRQLPPTDKQSHDTWQ